MSDNCKYMYVCVADTPGGDVASKLVCPCCQSVFAKSSGLATHIRLVHADFHARHFVDDSPIRASQRCSFTNEQKARVLDKYIELLNTPTCAFPYIETTKWAFGAVWRKRKGYLNRWLKSIGEVREKVLRTFFFGNKLY